MHSNISENAGSGSWLVTHLLSRNDAAAAAALRSSVAGMKGTFVGTDFRGSYDGLMENVPAPEGVTFETATIGGISGWWAKPAQARKGGAILHVHGGWFNWGSAKAYRNFVGHIASSAGTAAFVPDYRLAPEHPFPAAVTDVEACYRGLVGGGIAKVALTGDSAGGNLALVLLAITSARRAEGGVVPVGAVAFSPVTDLALTSDSYATRAEAEPYFTKPQAAELVRSYLADGDPKNAMASPATNEELGAVIDAHVRAEFVERSFDTTMATMTDAPYVTHVPVLTGVYGYDDVRSFYA